MIQSIYSKIINKGVCSNKSDTENKKNKLLNTYALFWGHFIVLFIFLDHFITRQLTFYVFLLYSFTIVSMITVVLLNLKDQYKKGRFLFLVMLFLNIGMLSLFIVPGLHIENYLIAISCIALSLYTKNTIPFIFLVLSLIVYFIPFYFYPMYPKEAIERVDVFSVIALFWTVYLIVNSFKKNNLVNEKKLAVAYQKLEETKKGELAHLQLKSLKAQMNPHFMFNAINSIQNLVLKGDKHEAYQYLSKFSNMLRENLSMSEKSFVSFDEELSLLNKYLELEKLRFKDDFEYQLLGVDIYDTIKIPSMIIQPFIENAINHGLLHKTHSIKKLTIEFAVEDVFKCVITDNGIGVKKSVQMNKDNELQHKSFSTNAINKRLELLRDYYKTDIGFTYLPSDIGTVVEIRIPYLKDVI